jgi:phosphoglycerate dehydrogenase-like enzyme
MAGVSPRVVAAAEFGPRLRAVLPADAELVLAPTESESDVAPLIATADVLVSEVFTPLIGRAATRLRLVQTTGAGTNDIVFDALPDGVAVCNVYGHSAAIAEYVLMAMLGLSRDLLNADRRLREGDWGDRQPRSELRGRHVLLIGFGHIGREVARYSIGLGMRVSAVTRRPDPARGADIGLEQLAGLDALGQLLPEADFVVVAVPLNAETTGLLSARELRLMRPSAFLINVGRGAVVVEEALYSALHDRAIAGAALDVWYRYPDGQSTQLPAARPFHALDNVIMTPHFAGWTHETTAYRWRTIAENIRRLAADEPLLNIVWPPTRNGTSTDRPA